MTARSLVIIPLFNEEKTIGSVIRNVKIHSNADVLVIDDGSTDNSISNICSSANVRLIRHEANTGYGKTLISGFDFAIKEDYEFVVTIDCDEQHEPKVIPDFFKELKEYDILSGSRYLNDFPEDDIPPQDRRQINLTITNRINAVTGFNLTDSFCGFKAYKVKSLAKLTLTEPGYAMPIQLWIQAWRSGLRVKEKAVVRIYKDTKRSFGSDLDDSKRRLRYYEKLLDSEIKKIKILL